MGESQASGFVFSMCCMFVGFCFERICCSLKQEGLQRQVTYASYATASPVACPAMGDQSEKANDPSFFSSIDIAAFKILVFVLQEEDEITSCERILRQRETSDCDSVNMSRVQGGA